MSLNKNPVTFNQIEPKEIKKNLLECGENLDIFAGVWYHQQTTRGKRNPFYKRPVI